MPVMNRLLNLFMVRPHEHRQFVYFLILFLVIGIGMAIGRGTADALFFKRYGIEYLPVMYMLLSMLLVLVSTLYAAYADRIPAEKYFVIFFIVLAGLLCINWALILFSTWENVYPLYFLIYELASELLLVHSGLYIAQNFETMQAKRLLPLVLAGTQMGTIVGGLFLTVASGFVGVQNMLLIWAMLSSVAVLMIHLHHRQSGVSAYFRKGYTSARRFKQSLNEITQGMRFLQRSALLRVSSLALFFTVIAFYILCYSVNRVYANTFTTEAELAAFFGMLTAVTSVCALFIQLFLTSRAIDKFGVKRMNMFFPAAVLVSFVGLMLSFALPLALLASFVKDALNPAVRNPVRNLFFQALPTYMQGRARAMSVALVMPAALAVTGGVLWLAQRSEQVTYFLVLGLFATVLYLFYSKRMNQAYVASIVDDLRDRVFVAERRERESGKRSEEEVYAELLLGLQQDDEELVIMAARSLCEIFQDRAIPEILERVSSASNRTTDQILRLIMPYGSRQVRPVLHQLFIKGDARLRATIMMFLAELKDDKLDDLIDTALVSPNPRFRAAGVSAALTLSLEGKTDTALDIWQKMFSSELVGENFAALDVFLRHADQRFAADLMALLKRSDQRLLIKTLDALCRLDFLDPACESQLKSMFQSNRDHRIRSAIMSCTSGLSLHGSPELLRMGLEDFHPEVRQSAVNSLIQPEQDKVGKLHHYIQQQDLSNRAMLSLISKMIEIGAPTSMLEELALDKARETMGYFIGLQVLGNLKPDEIQNYELIHMVLEERVQQSIDLVLLMLTPLESNDRMGVVRAAIQSKDARYVGSASEVVRHLHNRAIAQILGDILEDKPCRPDKEYRNVFSKLETVRDVLSWCRSQGDRWLVSCAEYTDKKVHG